MGPGAASSRSTEEVVEDRGIHGLHALRVVVIVVGLDLGAHEVVRRVTHNIDQVSVITSKIAQSLLLVQQLG